MLIGPALCFAGLGVLAFRLLFFCVFVASKSIPAEFAKFIEFLPNLRIIRPFIVVFQLV